MNHLSSDVYRPGPQALAPAGSVMAAAMRVLQRTAHSLATSPGGLRFVAGSRPWLPDGQPAQGPSPSSFPLLDCSA